MHAAEQPRLDKWLWAARFFKTRSLATVAVNGGKVHVNGARAKPAREVRVGDEIAITRGQERWQIVVQALSDRRGSALDAQKLYKETPASRETRARHAELRKLAAVTAPATPGKPDKKTRRLIHRFKQGMEP